MQDVNIKKSKVLEMYMRWKQLGQAEGEEDIQNRIRKQVLLNMLWKGEGQALLDADAAVYHSVYQKLQDGEEPSEEEEEYLTQNDPESWAKVQSIVRENERFAEKLVNCRTAEEVERTAEGCMDLVYTGFGVVESNGAIPIAYKVEYALFKDAKLSAIRNITRSFMESEAYGRLPTDAEYERQYGQLPDAEEGETPEEVEARCRRAIDGYGNVTRLLEEEDGEKSGFGAKG